MELWIILFVLFMFQRFTMNNPKCGLVSISANQPGTGKNLIKFVWKYIKVVCNFKKPKIEIFHYNCMDLYFNQIAHEANYYNKCSRSCYYNSKRKHAKIDFYSYGTNIPQTRMRTLLLLIQCAFWLNYGVFGCTCTAVINFQITRSMTNFSLNLSLKFSFKVP